MQMGDIGPCDEQVVVSVDQKSCKISLFCKHAVVGEDHCKCRNKEIVEMDLLMENLKISDEDDLNDLLLEEHENLHVTKTFSSSTSDKETSQFSSSNATQLKDLSKCAANLCSELSTIELGYESSVAVSDSAEDSLVSYYDSSKLVSAIKGSRARQGKPLDPNTHVTWGAVVFDPPVTSSSHTVKGHRHRLPKSKSSDHHRHKHMKAKPSSNASSGDRKHSHRRSSCSNLDPRMARVQALKRRLQENYFRLSKLEYLDAAAAFG